MIRSKETAMPNGHIAATANAGKTGTRNALRDDAALPLLLACSPRKQGNSDTAAALFAEGFAAGSAAAGHACPPPQPLFLRDFTVSPCIGCGSCERLAKKLAATGRHPDVYSLAGQGEHPIHPPFGCPFAQQDDSPALLLKLLTAPSLLLVSPIYFYHLPAMLKALIDRTQPFWSLKDAGVFTPSATAAGKGNARGRVCRVILIGARKQGGKLFEGSMLSLRYALGPLGYVFAEPLLLHGLDGAQDLRAEENKATREAVAAYGRDAGMGFAPQG